MPFVVIDNDSKLLERCATKGCLFLEGDASNDDILREAGILKAKGLVSTTSYDAENVYVMLSAKGIREDLLVVARVSD